jgi:hypothetical protein
MNIAINGVVVEYLGVLICSEAKEASIQILIGFVGG